MRLRPDVDVDAAAVLIDGTRPTRRAALRRLAAVRRSVIKVVITAVRRYVIKMVINNQGPGP